MAWNKLKDLETKIFTSDTAADLETQINNFFSGSELSFVEIRFTMVPPSRFAVLIIYHKK